MKTNQKILIGLAAMFMLATSALPAIAQAEGTDPQKKELELQHREMELKKKKLEIDKREMELQKKEMEVMRAKMDKQKERIEAQRVAFITDRLQLTVSEAQAFWPVYNEYEKKRQFISQGYPKPGDKDLKDPEEMTDKEALEIADGQLVEAQKMFELRKEYHSKFRNLLPPKKLLRLYESEKDFQRMLIDRLRDERGAGQGAGKGKGQGAGQGQG